MPPPALSLRQLNRTLLERQMLLHRTDLPVATATERLGALQAQVNNPPYIGLWTRLHTFERLHLTSLMEERQIVRAPLLRSTLHLITGGDYLRWWQTLQPALARALSAFFGQKAKGLNIDALVNAARAQLQAGPLSFTELATRLLDLAPDSDTQTLAYVVRSHLPLVIVPPGGAWGKGGVPLYALAESWLDRPLDGADGLRDMLWRYLAAFGPASIMDFQAWSGLTRMKDALEPLTRDLIVYRDERGRELFDLPDASMPPEDVPAPVRFIPEYDNLLLSHDDRARIISDEVRPLVFLSAGRVRSTILVDGVVRGAWKIERIRKAALLLIEPFAPLSVDERTALEDEGARLLHWVEDAAQSYDVRILGVP